VNWDERLARPRARDAAGVLTVLEEIDDDTGAATYRRAGQSHVVRRAAAPADVAPRRTRPVAAGVAAAGLALLAARRRP
jgi:hypothetical protein